MIFIRKMYFLPCLPLFVTLICCVVGIISAGDTCPQSGYGYAGIKYSARQPYNCTLYTDPHNTGENNCALSCSRMKTLCPFFSVTDGKNCTVCVSSGASNTTTKTLTAANYSLAADAFIFEKQDEENQCSADTCLNNGTCIDGYLDYHCNCTKVFIGKNCGDKWPYVDCIEVGEAKHVSAGLAGVWAISESNTVMLRQNESWVNIGTRLLTTVSSGLIVCGCYGNGIYCKQGITTANPEGDDWTEISDGQLRQVDVNDNGYWWGVSSNAGVYKRASPTSSWSGSGWEGEAGIFRQVTMGGAGVWVITIDGQVQYRVGTYEDDLSFGSVWQVVDLQGLDGSPLYIESAEGYVWLCTSTYAVYRWAFSVDQLNDVSWEKVPTNGFKKISITASKLWGITSDNKVMECT